MSTTAAETAWTYLAFDGFWPYVDNRATVAASEREQSRYGLRLSRQRRPGRPFLTVTLESRS
jgi:hypothetical protein